MWPVALGQIQTSVQAGGIARAGRGPKRRYSEVGCLRGESCKPASAPFALDSRFRVGDVDEVSGKGPFHLSHGSKVFKKDISPTETRHWWTTELLSQGQDGARQEMSQETPFF